MTPPHPAGPHLLHMWVPTICGLAVVVLAMSPIVHDAAHVSFVWHMVQHLLLLLVAGPLLAVGISHILARRRAAAPRWPTTPRLFVASLAYLATIIFWHLPPAYDAAIAEASIHGLEHVSLLGASIVMWASLSLAARTGGKLPAILALAGSAVTGMAVGLVLLGAPVSLYASHGGPHALWEQQIGGALMKVSSLLVHGGAAVWLAAQWVAFIDAVDRGHRSQQLGKHSSPSPPPSALRETPGPPTMEAPRGGHT